VEGNKEASENLDRYHQIVAAIFRPVAFIFPFVTKLPTAYNRKLDKSIVDFQNFLSHIIATHRCVYTSRHSGTRARVLATNARGLA
jgi:hypothetical protein